ncbi:MAG: single-stranded DNA-binding protein [Candidatus Moraniibacteriota bacterium]
MNVNKVILVGRLTRDPEIRSTPSGQSVATISLATNSFWTDKGGQRQERTEFHTVVLWGRLAEIAGQYLTRGQECFIEGRLQTRTYTAKDGAERKTTEIVADNMQLGNRAQGSGAPQRPAQNEGGYSQPANKRPATESSQPTPDDEIPTINLDDEKDDIRIEDVPF